MGDVCVIQVLRPRSCRDIQKMELGEEDGEYQLYPNRKCSAAISVSVWMVYFNTCPSCVNGTIE